MFLLATVAAAVPFAQGNLAWAIIMVLALIAAVFALLAWWIDTRERRDRLIREAQQQKEQAEYDEKLAELFSAEPQSIILRNSGELQQVNLTLRMALVEARIYWPTTRGALHYLDQCRRVASLPDRDRLLRMFLPGDK